MSVRSYLVYPAPGQRDAVMAALRTTGDVWPAEQHEVLVLVAEQDDDPEADRAFDEQLHAVPGVMSVAFVAGFSE